MRYFALFNESGNRITSFVEGVHFEVKPGYEIFGTDDNNEQVAVGWEPEQVSPPIPDEFIEITEEEQHLYATNQYIRGTDGKPMLKQQTAAETLTATKVTKLAEIKALLAETDYKCLKYVDGDLTEADYAETKALRKSLRLAYNTIESATDLTTVNSVVYQ